MPQGSADLRTAILHDAAALGDVPPVEPLDLTFLSPAEQPDKLGRLGEYRVVKELGHGGMGAVFLAEDPKLKRMVALKVMLPHVAKEAVNRERFLREAQAAAQLEHDNIVSVYQVSEANGVPFIAMPFLKGESLLARLRREPPLSVSEILHIGQQIAEGLAAAHDVGLVHRDIKPANIWLESKGSGGEGQGSKQAGSRSEPFPRTSAASDHRAISACRVKILDFGLARLRTSGDAQHLTMSGTVLGTPSYMSPEQAQGSHDVDFRSDLFSLGVVMYRMATGRLPFPGDNIYTVIHLLANTTPTVPSDLNRDLPRELSDLILQLLAKSPAARPASAHEVAQRLAMMAVRSAACEGSSTDRVPTFETPDSRTQAADSIELPTTVPYSELQASRVRRRRRVLISAAVAACAVLAAFVIHKMATPGHSTVLNLSNEPQDQNAVRDARGPRVASFNSETDARVSRVPQDDRANWPDWAKELREPPPLEGWLKGRKVLSVQQDGSAMFQTIQAALDKVQPGEVIRVLDKGPYRERLVSINHPGNFGLVSDVNTVIELSKWELEQTVKTGWLGHAFAGINDLRISGFTFVCTAPADDTSLDRVPTPMFLQKVSGLCLEDCVVMAPQIKDNPQSNLSTESSIPVFAMDQVCLRRNVFGPRVRLSAGLAPYHLLATNCYFTAHIMKHAQLGIDLDQGSHRILLDRCIFYGHEPSHAIAVSAGREKGTAGDDYLAISRNTFRSSFDSPSTLLAIYGGVGQDVTIRDNLFSTPTLGFLFGDDAFKPLAAKAREEWLVRNNWGGQRSPLPDWVPLTDPSHTGELPYLSVDPEHPNFLRLDPDKLPADVQVIPGALPPGPPPATGDWFTRLQSRLKEAQAASRAQYK